MMNFDGQEMRDGFEKAFGFPITDLDEAQIRWIVNVAKHVRGRCRRNDALNYYLARNFPQATFRQVTKTNPNGTSYEGLEIAVKEPHNV